MNGKIEIVTGQSVIPWIDEVSRLRIKVFREYPYLYEGDFEYEAKYMKGYASDPKSVFVIIKVDDKLAGVATGIPLVSESDIVKEARGVFEDNGKNPREYYYFGEAVLLPEYRGRGFYNKLVSVREQKTKEWGYKKVCFLAVKREESHPQKPTGYKSNDQIFKHFGFQRTSMHIKYNWPTIMPDGTVQNLNHSMAFWVKELAQKVVM